MMGCIHYRGKRSRSGKQFEAACSNSPALQVKGTSPSQVLSSTVVQWLPPGSYLHYHERRPNDHNYTPTINQPPRSLSTPAPSDLRDFVNAISEAEVELERETGEESVSIQHTLIFFLSYTQLMFCLDWQDVTTIPDSIQCPPSTFLTIMIYLSRAPS